MCLVAKELSLTNLMTATLAQVAGVENIVVVTPPQPNGVSQED